MGIEQLIWSFVPIGLGGVGIAMLFWPRAVIVHDRDPDEKDLPISRVDLGMARIIGLVLTVVGLYGVYRMLGGTWGAGPPDPGFDPVLF